MSKDKHLQLIAKRLRIARAASDVSQAEAAFLAGISQSTLSLYEKAKREPRILVICRLAELYGTTVDYLLGLSCELQEPHF